MDWIFGAVGFLGFEGLKIYRRVWAGMPIVDTSRRLLYIVTMLWLAVFSGAVAFVLADGDSVKALFIGFSVPAGLKGLIVAPRNGRGDMVDDIEVTKRNALWKALSWLNEFFYFP